MDSGDRSEAWRGQDLADTGARLASISERFCTVRNQTEEICAPLETEDHVVQPAAFVSPPKWHLAHTTWFFDRFVLQAGGRQPASRIPDRNLIFNSYYKSQGQHWLQENRGHLSRPTVREVLDYRRAVTGEVASLLRTGGFSAGQCDIVELGIHHEQQHQELLFMDIKYIFAQHPRGLAYDDRSSPVLPVRDCAPPRWLGFEAGLGEFGAGSAGFSYDNERPRHRHWLEDFQLADRLVNNGDYLAFIEDGGYRQPELWLSDGWDWLRREGIAHPLYWHQGEAGWREYHLGGWQALQPELPVSHLSYYEADAFARWWGARLPTEFELEHGQRAAAADSAGDACWAPGRGLCPTPERAADAWGNGLLWQWTSSAYGPYPGFVPEAGGLGEYNGKFMCNQQVLRGGCVATPRHHLRPTYRNFYRPADRWAFTGLRLARDL